MKIIKVIIFVILFLAFPLAIKAEEPISTPPGSLTEKIKERLQETAEEGLVAIKEQLTSKALAPRKKAYVGKITNLDKNQIALTYKEQNLIAYLNQDTEYVKGTNTDIEFDDLKVNDYAITMGFYSSADEKFTATRVSVIKQPEAPINRQLIQGKITEVDGQKLKINNKIISLTNKTNLLISGVKAPETEDISLGDHIFAIVTMDQNGDIDLVNTVFVQPGRQNPAGLEPTNRPTSTSSSNVED